MAAADYANVVQQLYVSYFGRPADYYGLQNFEAQLNTMGAPTTVAGIAAAVQAGTNVALVKLVNSFNAAPESVALYGAGTTQIEISKFVAGVYTNVLGRPADVAGANWWINEIVSGRLTKANAALAISAGALTNTTAQGVIDAATITAKVAVATDFTTSLDTIPEINAFSGDAAAAAARAMLATVTNTTTVATFHATVDATIAGLGTAATAGQTFTLTTGADNVVGTAGNDVISVITTNALGGAASTAQSFDKIDGGAGTDTLNWYATATENIVINPTITNVEVARFYGAELITGGIDATLVGGSQQIWLQSAGAPVTVTGLSGKTLGIDGKTTGLATGNFGTALTAAVALNAASDAAGTGNALVDVAGVATTLAVSGNGKVTLTDNAAAADTIKTLTVAANGVTALTVAALTALTAIDGSASTGNTTLVGNVAGVVSLKTGAGNDTFTVTATAKATVDSGAGNDTVTLGSALAAGSTVNLGAGNDKLLSAAGSVAASSGTLISSIDAGDGVDTVAAALINAGNGSLFKNFEGVDVSGFAGTLDAALLTGSTVSAITLSAASANGTLNNVARGAILEVSSTAAAGTGLTIGVTGAAAATDDVFGITFAGAAVAAAGTVANVIAGTVTTAGVETVNVVSGGAANTWNSAVLGTDNQLKTVTITGAQNLDLTVPVQTALVGSATKDALTLVDGSAATGKLTIAVTTDAEANPTLVVKGGSAVDTLSIVNISNLSGSIGTLTGGAGNDIFKVEGTALGTSVNAGAFITISDFTKGDIIDGTDAVVTFTTTKTNVNAAVTLAAAIDIAAAGGATNATWFNYGANTYVVFNNDAALTAAATDVVVQLTGVLDLSTATIAAGNLTFA